MAAAPTPSHGALTPAARRGYGLGSVATGLVRHGARPAPPALPHRPARRRRRPRRAHRLPPQGLGRAPQPRRRPDQRPLDQPRRADAAPSSSGRAACWPCLRPALRRADLAAGPAATWVAVAYLACATAYAFFQVPYVAMPAEMTDDYDERTRLMTWRVAILALAILVSGGLSPVIRDALGPSGATAASASSSARLILVGTVGAWWGTRPHRSCRAATAGGSLRRPAPGHRGPRPFRTLLAVFVLQALATGAMLAGVDYVALGAPRHPRASTCSSSASSRPALLVTPLWQRVRRGPRQAHRLPLGLRPPRRGCPRHLVTVHARCRRDRTHASPSSGPGTPPAQMFPLAMLPDVAADTAARARRRARHLHRGVDRRRDARARARAPLYAGVLALGGYVSSTDARPCQPDSARSAIARWASPSCPPCSSPVRWSSCAATASTRRCPDDPT